MNMEKNDLYVNICDSLSLVAMFLFPAKGFIQRISLKISNLNYFLRWIKNFLTCVWIYDNAIYKFLLGVFPVLVDFKAVGLCNIGEFRGAASGMFSENLVYIGWKKIYAHYSKFFHFVGSQSNLSSCEICATACDINTS